MSGPLWRDDRGKYHVGDEIYDGVTSVLSATCPKDGLTFWAGGLVYDYLQSNPTADRSEAVLSINRARDNAAWRGTAVHRVAESILRGEDVDESALPPVTRPYVASLRRLASDHAPTCQVSEQSVINTRHRYAGTLDGVWTIGDRTRVIDIKTRDLERKCRLYDENVLQLAAYRNATDAISVNGARGRLPETCGSAVVFLYPASDGELGYKITLVNDTEDDYNGFVHALELYRWQRGRKKRR